MSKEREGLYYEEVEKIVDGLVEDIRGGFLKDRLSTDTQLQAAVTASSYVQVPQLAAEVLMYSQYPCRSFADGVFQTEEECLQTCWLNGRVAFPWVTLARSAMYADCYDALRDRSEYHPLPTQEKHNG